MLFLALLIPSGKVAWTHRDMPHLGILHDDSLYVIAGHSIAHGLGPKIQSLPGEPAQTKYPPGLPALVAFVWIWNPDPATIRPWLTLLSWSFVPMLLGGLLVLYRLWGLPAKGVWTLVGFLALSCYLAMFGTTVMSEVLFTALLAATLIAVDREQWVLAGALAGLTCLTRTTGLVLLVAIPAAVWLQRRSLRGLVFSVVLFPFLAGWAVWTRVYRSAGVDHMTAYYTDYFRDLLWNASFSNYHLLLWKNIDGFLLGIGRLLVPVAASDGMSRALVQGLGIAAVIGAWRLCRAYPRALPYGLTALLMSVMLIAWCYPPNERLTFPVFPLLLAGIGVELARFAASIRQSWTTQRGAALVIGTAVAGLLVLAGNQHVVFWREVLPSYYRLQTRVNADNNACYGRIRAELPADASFVAHHDPVLWMLTGRHAVRITYRTALWYEDRPADILAVYKDAVGFARRHNLQYVMQNRLFQGDLSDDDFQEFWRSLESNPQLESVFTCGTTRVWRVVQQN